MSYKMCSCIESKIITPTKFYGRFILGPFASGQGLTVANSLRRSLLSELPCTAINFVYIEKVRHEYESLPGLKECVLDILLNLKKLCLTTEFTRFSPQVAFIHLKGPKVIRAKDLKLPFFIACVDPQQYIATLSEKGELVMKLLIFCEKGQPNQDPLSAYYDDCVNLINCNHKVAQNKKRFRSGRDQTLSTVKDPYETVFHHGKLKPSSKPSSKPTSKPSSKPSSKNRSNINVEQGNANLDPVASNKGLQLRDAKPRISGGYFPINNAYCPVSKANYSIETPDDTNEMIYLEIWTNGTMDPRHALEHAVQGLIDLFLPLQQIQRVRLSAKQTHYVHVNKLQGALRLKQRGFQKLKEHIRQNPEPGLENGLSQTTALNAFNHMLHFMEASKQQLNQTKHRAFTEEANEAEMQHLSTFLEKQKQKQAKALRKSRLRKPKSGPYGGEKTKKQATVESHFFISQAQLNKFVKYVLNDLQMTMPHYDTYFSVDLLNLDLRLKTILTLKRHGIHKMNQLLKPRSLLWAYVDDVGVDEITQALQKYLKQWVENFKQKPSTQLKNNYEKFKEFHENRRVKQHYVSAGFSSAVYDESKPLNLVPKLSIRRLYLRKLTMRVKHKSKPTRLG